MKNFNYSSFIKQLSRNNFLRSHLIKQIDKHLYRQLVDENDRLLKLKIKRYQYLSAMLYCLSKNILCNDVLPTGRSAEESLNDNGFYSHMVEYDNSLQKLTLPVWKKEFLKQ